MEIIRYKKILIIISLLNLIICEAFDGLTLITTIGNQNNPKESILIDNDENIVNTWIHETKTASIAYLTSDSILYVPCKIGDGSGPALGPYGGRFKKVTWDGEIIWDYILPNDICLPHHDIEVLPNGNILAICSETKTQDEAENAGRVEINGTFTLDMIIEIEPVGDDDANIVWSWHFWDHLIQDVNPELDNYGIISEDPHKLDINYNASYDEFGVQDWNHLNCISFNPMLNQIVFSSRQMNEFYVIDHSTTTEEASSNSGGLYDKGGDFLYRWGSPNNYDRGEETDQILEAPHGVNWIPEGYLGQGNFILFNNIHDNINDISAVIEIVPPINEDGSYNLDTIEPFAPISYDWIHQSNFYSATQSGAFRLSNGNTIITSAGDDNRIFEINTNGEIQWEYGGDLKTARAIKYSYDYFGDSTVGDINNDSVINILDVIIIINIILELEGNNLENADINNDGIIDILDIIILINIIISD